MGNKPYITADKLKKYRFLILFSGVLIVFIFEVVRIVFARESFFFSIAESIILLLMALGAARLIFYIDDQRSQQLKKQLGELTDSYQYIGKINRQMSTLFDSTKIFTNEKSYHDTVNYVLDTILNSIKGEMAMIYYTDQGKAQNGFLRTLTRDEVLIAELKRLKEPIFKTIKNFLNKNPDREYIIGDLFKLSKGFKIDIFINTKLAIFPIIIKGELIGGIAIVYKYKQITDEEKRLLKNLTIKLGVIKILNE